MRVAKRGSLNVCSMRRTARTSSSRRYRVASAEDSCEEVRGRSASWTGATKASGRSSKTATSSTASRSGTTSSSRTGFLAADLRRNFATAAASLLSACLRARATRLCGRWRWNLRRSVGQVRSSVSTARRVGGKRPVCDENCADQAKVGAAKQPCGVAYEPGQGVWSSARESAPYRLSAACCPNMGRQLRLRRDQLDGRVLDMIGAESVDCAVSYWPGAGDESGS